MDACSCLVPRRVLALCALISLSAACSADDDDLTGNTITGVVEYEGSLDGSLIIGAFKSYPVESGPVSFISIPAPQFPQEYEVDYVPTGSFYVIAVLDVGRDNPTVPGEEDIMAVHDPIAISETEPTFIDFTLEHE